MPTSNRRSAFLLWQLLVAVAGALIFTSGPLAPSHAAPRPLRHALRAKSLCSAVSPTQGDTIRVTADVAVKGRSAKGLTGTVLKVFGEGDDATDDWGACCELAWGEPTITARLQRKVTGYFDFRELTLLHRDQARVAAFEARERERWRAVYDEDWTPPAHRELVEGDRVQVVADVAVKGYASARGMQGVVANVWAECETDAACCCNELATAPVTVELEPEEEGELIGYFCSEEVEVLDGAAAG